MKKTILVLASNSFTGAHFIRHALQNGYRVIGVSRSPEYDPVMLAYRYRSELQNFRFIQLDINLELDKLLELADQERPEIIANFAAQGEVRNSWKYPDQWYQTNCLSVVRLTNALKDRTYIEKYYACSTPEVYGNTGIHIVENNNYNPSTPYAASKLAGDLHLMTLYKRYGFPVVFTRSANVYGIHQQLYRIIPRTILFLKLGRKIELHGGGRAIRAFVHIHDVVDATLKVIEQGKSGDAYHVSTNEEISIANLVRMICEMMGCDFEKSTCVLDENFGQDERFSMSYVKIHNELGWIPGVSLKEGISEIIEWIEGNWATIKKMPLEYIHKF